MGQEVVYCFKCGTRLKGSEFEKGSAFKIGDKTCCATCAVGLLTSLPPEEQQSILNKVMSAENAGTKRLVVQGEFVAPEAEPVSPTATPRPTPSPRSATDAISKTKLATPKTIRSAAFAKPPTQATQEASSKSTMIFVGVGVALAALIGSFMALGGGRGGPRPTSHNDPGAVEPGPTPAPEAPKPPESTRPNGVVAPAPAREEGARKALEKAREFARTSPSDLSGQIKAYQQAVWETEGTSLFEESKKELAPLLEKQKTAFNAELAAVEEKIRGPYKEEDFKAVLGLLDEARKSHGEIEWTMPIDRKINDVKRDVDELYKGLKTKALDAKRAGGEADVKSLGERVAKWGLEAYSADLKKSLDDIASSGPSAPVPANPAPAKPEDEAQTYRGKWDQAMALANARDYPGAAALLQAAAGVIQDGTLRGEALADVEVVRLVTAMYDDTLDALSEWPEGRALSVKYTDETGVKKSLSEAVVLAGRYRAELKKGKTGSTSLDYGDIDAESLAKIFKGRKKKDAKADGRAIAYFCLLEGDSETAKSSLGEPVSAIPEKYWALGKRVAEARSKAPKPDAEAVKKEREARDLLALAEKEYHKLETRPDGVAKFKSLLSNYAETSFVKRNQALFNRRSQGTREAALFGADIKGVGTMKSQRDKDGDLIWTSDSDSTAKMANYVDLEFYAEANVRYNFFVYLGGCCQEVLTFHMQGTEMSGTNSQGQPAMVEPGTTNHFTVRLQAAGFPDTHAAHGGRKEPSRWLWTNLRIPVYATPGLKKIRLLTDQQGFSIAVAVLSAGRFNRPPTPAEFKQLQRDR